MKLETLKQYLPLPTAIVGLGKSGLGAKALLESLGVDVTQIFTLDDKTPDHQRPDFTFLKDKGIRSLIVSPGYPLNTPWILEAQQEDIKITSELSLASLFLDDERVIGITGSVGKSTTTVIIGEALQVFDPLAFVGGNLGIPLSEYVLGVVKGQPRAKWIALELSSYQLENLENLSLDAAVITSLMPNHLERYPDLESYYSTKLRIQDYNKGPLVLNKIGGDLFRFLSGRPLNNPLWTGPQDHPDFDFNRLNLVGGYNQDNAALAIALIKYFKWPAACYLKVQLFKGLPHRLERLPSSTKYTFINDSKATTIQSVIAAVKTVSPSVKKTLHLLIGGKDKDLRWEDLSALSPFPNTRFYFFGQVGPSAQLRSGLEGPCYPTLAQALDKLPQMQPGDTLMLSPGGTSLDEFTSFEQRGDFFKNWAQSRYTRED